MFSKFESLFIILFFSIYFSPYLILGENTYLNAHDNLDQSNMVGIFDGYFQGNFFNINNSPEFALPGNNPRLSLHSIRIDKALFYFFGYFWGYVLNEIIIRLIAFFGMFLLINYFNRQENVSNTLLILSSFAFSSLPFWSMGNLSIAGLPLLLRVFINLYFEKSVFISCLFIACFAFYSSFFVSGIFIGFIIIFTFCYLLNKGMLNIYLFGGATLLLIFYIISNYNLFYIQFFSDIQTFRTEFSRMYLAKKTDALKAFTSLLYNNQYHAVTNHGMIMLPSIFVLIIENFKSSRQKPWIVILSLFILFSSFIYGCSFFVPFVENFKIFSGLSLNRFYWLSPLAWYLLWSILLLELMNKVNFNFNFLFTISVLSVFFGDSSIMPISKALIILILLIIWSFKVLYTEKISSLKLKKIIIGALFSTQILLNTFSYLYPAFVYSPSFKDFYSKDQFVEIVNILKFDKEKERIGCIGFYPSVANYNGIKTVGAYSSMYDLNFKKKFYDIINGEISLNSYLYDYFTKWGGRAYLFDNEIGKPYYDQQYRINRFNPEISTKLNVRELKKMGINFLFSVSKITNDKEKGLELVLESKKDEYFYNLYVYRIN